MTTTQAFDLIERDKRAQQQAEAEWKQEARLELLRCLVNGAEPDRLAAVIRDLDLDPDEVRQVEKAMTEAQRQEELHGQRATAAEQHKFERHRLKTGLKELKKREDELRSAANKATHHHAKCSHAATELRRLARQFPWMFDDGDDGGPPRLVVRPTPQPEKPAAKTKGK
jgi:DNA repair ATPase RecN